MHIILKEFKTLKKIETIKNHFKGLKKLFKRRGKFKPI